MHHLQITKNKYMKEYLRNLTAAIGTSAALLSTATGCGFETQREVCQMNGGEVKNIDGPARAEEICAQSKSYVMKCLKSEEGFNGETVPQTIKCNSNEAGTQIASAFNDNDYTVCHASKNAHDIEITCK